jgi:hypothetical protein
MLICTAKVKQDSEFSIFLRNKIKKTALFRLVQNNEKAKS